MRSAILMLACSLTATGDTVTLTSAKDSDIYSYSDRPTGTTSTLGINSSGAGSPHSQRSLIQFNLTGLAIPSGEIGAAKLRLFVVPPDPAFGALTPGNVEVFRQTAAWTITNPTLRWNHFLAADSAGLLVVPAGSSGSWTEIDVTPLVVAWASGGVANHGFALQAQSESIALNVTFASMEFPGYAPQLVITRAVAPAAPPALTLTATGNSFDLRWPVADSGGWVLQTAESLAGPWTQVIGATQSSGSWQVSAAPNASGRGFFRLSKP
ncbi:DNRLRE domain-containing protein [Luteolibacter arcticus]|uniref:DNRLRE domain-containing protein n=1 Tax=Luteolibacter arcticus TaxID=1581411 RepID=A0ABT3GJ16_9BACT|nr:DNRLRE domain-containing protein [Luteolibacter arcticus]MCW1923484.1 DNRLRE domain-containing protein [Luteolibacter arcticus]